MSSRIDPNVITLLDAKWWEFAPHAPIEQRAAIGERISEAQSDPLLVLTYIQQIEDLRAMGIGAGDSAWARELARDFARLSECDWRRGPAIPVRIHTPDRDDVCARVLRIDARRLWLSPQPWLEIGVRVVLEHDDPGSQSTIQLSGCCVDSTREYSAISTRGPCQILWPSLRTSKWPI